MLQPKTIGEPYTGNLYVRFDEGGGLFPRLYSNVEIFKQHLGFNIRIYSSFKWHEYIRRKLFIYSALVRSCGRSSGHKGAKTALMDRLTR